jgi:hypothetical protein
MGVALRKIVAGYEILTAVTMKCKLTDVSEELTAFVFMIAE